MSPRPPRFDTLAAALAALALALGAPSPGAAQIRDAGAFGATCPVPPRPAAGSAGRLVLPGALAAVPSPDADTPGLPLARTQSRRALSPAGGWPAGAPPAIVFLGADPGSLAVAQGLPGGAAVYVLPPARPETLARARAVCPSCVVGPGGAGAAAALGVRAYPAVVRWTGTVVEIIEGPP